MMTDESTGDNDLIQFASPKVMKAAAVAAARYNDSENKENKHHAANSYHLLNDSFNGPEHDTEIGRRVEPAPKPSPALLSSITSLLDSTILENASATLNGSYYDSIISPLTPSVFDENKMMSNGKHQSSAAQQQTPVSTRGGGAGLQHQRESLGEPGKLLNETNLDVVDFIEVNNDSMGVEQEDFWLCDPKSTRQTKQVKQQPPAYVRPAAPAPVPTPQPPPPPPQQQPQQVLNEQTQNTTTTTTVNGQRVKNPYKWIKEEFEDKNLDKVKRTLLVTLDDIAKGYNRRSRSVSTTRTSLSTYYIPNQHQTPLQQQLHHYQHHQQQPQSEPAAAAASELADLAAKKSRNGTAAASIPHSKSIESILNESTADDDAEKENECDETLRGVTVNGDGLNRTYSKQNGAAELYQHLSQIVNNGGRKSDAVVAAGESAGNVSDVVGGELKRSATICIKSRRKSKPHNHQLPTIDQSVYGPADSVELASASPVKHVCQENLPPARPRRRPLANSHSMAFFTSSRLPPAESLLSYFDESSLFRALRAPRRSRSRSVGLAERADALTGEIDLVLRHETATVAVDPGLVIDCLDENAYFEPTPRSDRYDDEPRQPEPDSPTAGVGVSVDELIREIEDELLDRCSSSQSSLASSPAPPVRCACPPTASKCRCACHGLATAKSTSNSPAAVQVWHQHRSTAALVGASRTRSNSNRFAEKRGGVGGSTSTSFNCSQNSLEWDLGSDMRASSDGQLERLGEHRLLDDSRLVAEDNYAELLLLDQDCGVDQDATAAVEIQNVIDSSSSAQHAANYATMIKRKNSNLSPTQADMNLNDSAYLTTQSDDSNQADYVGRHDMSHQQPQAAQYEDMLDVQVIAKMQEESLRQSVLNKSTESNLNRNPTPTAAEPSHFKRGTYSTATITKRTNSRLSHATPVINFDHEQHQQQQTTGARRDSVSSSDHSSLSSTASNFESPYASHANVNDFYWDEDVIQAASVNTTLVEQPAAGVSKSPSSASCSLCGCCLAGLGEQQQVPEAFVKMLREQSGLRASSSVQEFGAQTEPFDAPPAAPAPLSSSSSGAKSHKHHLKYLKIENAKTKSVDEDQRARKSPKKVTANGGLNARRPTELVSTFLANKAANSSLSLATAGSGYQTITKSSSGLAKQINSSTRSNTPNRPAPVSAYSVVNGSGGGGVVKSQADTRLPTPRTSRSSLGNGYLAAAGGAHAKSKSPSQLNRTYLQQQQQMHASNGHSTTALNKPPPAPSVAQNGNGGVTSSGVRTGRPLLAYGGQRSATTSIISQSNSNAGNAGHQTSWQLNKLQKQQQQQQQQQLQQQQQQIAQQQQLLQQQQQFLQQQQILMQKQRMAATATTGTMSHATTSHSLASSNSIHNMSANSPRSPTSSISASSSINQMAPLNASSPRSRNESRNQSPNYNGGGGGGGVQQKLMSTIISPSGLLTNGPLGRRTITSPSRMRERSSSPGGGGYNHQLGYGSNGNLQAAPDSARKAAQQMRRSFLPQPVQFQSQQQQQMHPSVSPIRTNSTAQLLAKNLTPAAGGNWKDGCF